MMNTIVAAWPAIVTVLSVTFAIASIIHAQRSHTRQRARDLTATAAALEAHYDAVDVLLKDPATPSSMKDELVVFSSAVSDRDMAIWVAMKFRSGELLRNAKSAPYKEEEFELIRKTRPDLMDALLIAVGSGIMAMMLRWPETSPVFQEMMAAIGSNMRNEFTVARRVAKTSAKRGLGENGSMVAVPV